MNSPAPRISVVIPLYNQAPYIQRTVESVLKQTVQDFEILVIDDGSTDGGGEVVATFTDPRVRLITQENSGVSTARNRGAKEAGGALLSFLDADDEWFPDFLETILSLADDYSKCSVYATSYSMKNPEGDEQAPLKRCFPSLDSSFVFDNYFEAAAVSSPPFCVGTVAVKKEAFEQIGGFPETIFSGEEDLVTWARLHAYFDIAYSPIPKFYYWKTSFSWKHDKRVPEMKDLAGQRLVELLKSSDVQASKKVGLRRYLALWKKIRASNWIAQGYRVKALSAIVQSLWYYPLNWKVWCYIPFLMLPSAARDRLIRFVESNRDSTTGRI